MSKLIYTADERHQNTEKEESTTRENFQILQPSSWWHWMRQTEEGKEVMRSLIQQLLWAAKACHDRNITHRDIKPENMVVCATKGGSGNCLRGLPSKTWPYNLTMRVIDFVAQQVAPYKKVRRVVFVSEIPKIAAGKILRKDLIKLATSKLDALVEI